MYLKEELWLIIIGLIVAWVVKTTSCTTVPYKRIAIFSSSISLVVGLFGLLVKGIQPKLAFFPTDVRGLLLISLAAFIAAKIAAYSSKNNHIEIIKKRKRAKRQTK